MDRRRFLQAATVAAGSAGLATLPAAPAAGSVGARELAGEHADDPALLIDLSRCTGCGACVAACKLRAGLPWRSDQPAVGPEAELASSNRTVVRSIDPAGPGEARYVKRQCLHCLDPACVSACPVRALRKDPAGPVTYDEDRCIGCRYCLMACPFGVPTFEWDEAISGVEKCDLCADRTIRGEPTACAAACPAGAIRFGPRAEVLAEAEARIAAEPERYVDHVYGETEAGGTSVLFVSDVSFAGLGFVQGLPDRALPEYTWQISRLIPPVAAGLGALLLALHHRRRVLERREREEASEP
jgi:formate dehydrogenase iron-sulfur subunit